MHAILSKDMSICHDCFIKFKPKLNTMKIGGVSGCYIYNYDDVVKEKLYQFKGCFDIELATIFLDYFRFYLRLKYFGYLIVPAPSSKEADEKRGFNHVQEMFKPLGLKMCNCVHKLSDFKQSDFSAEERKQVGKKMMIDNVNLTGKKVLIVDDVYTTGSTVKAMIEMVKSKNPKAIKVLVMSKTKDINGPAQNVKEIN